MSVLVCAVTLVALASCGGSSKSSKPGPGTASPRSADPAVVKLVPSAVKAKGTLIVATDPTYAPNEFIANDNKTIVGTDVDFANALGAVMGLKVKMVSSTFDSLIPGLAAGKYDLGMASFTDTREREKVVDFVTYLSAGTAFFTRTQGGTEVESLNDLCGHSVAVEKGTTTETDASAQSAKCRKQGRPPVDVEIFPGQDGANLAVSSGRADLGMADSPVAGYQVRKSNGALKLVGKTYGTAPYGIAIPKGNGLAKAILAAVQVLMRDGTYREVLTKWGVQAGAIGTPRINGAIS
jgi:polar amino acid transport system substrate-binding protein